MAATFRCNATFFIRERHIFVVVGEIVDGSVRADMVLEIPRQGSEPVRLEIAAVERVSGPRPPEIGLCVRFGSDEELAALQGLSLEGSTLRAE
ncbi:MAG TPA: hypothetical protein VHY91_20870 [Pirellulales bacterium]|jgi:hypothetical protein|nr:hypothetical protein [Pirellulales bacterium]